MGALGNTTIALGNMMGDARRRRLCLAVTSLACVSALVVLSARAPAAGRRAELVGGYEAGAANYYGALPPVYGPVTVTQTVVPRTSVIVPICDKLGCYQMNACVDRWDFQTEYGGCEVYGDWTQRMGYCEEDADAFGVKASMACPVSCDSCALGMCFKPATNEMAACDGDGQVTTACFFSACFLCFVYHLISLWDVACCVKIA